MEKEVQGRSNNSLTSSRVSHKAGIQNHSSASFLLLSGKECQKSEEAGNLVHLKHTIYGIKMEISSTKDATKKHLGTPLELVCVR